MQVVNYLFNCRVIPNRGSWLDFEYDVKDFYILELIEKENYHYNLLICFRLYKKRNSRFIL